MCCALNKCNTCNGEEKLTVGNLLFSSWVFKKKIGPLNLFGLAFRFLTSIKCAYTSPRTQTMASHARETFAAYLIWFFLREFKTSICMLVNEALPLIVPLFLVSQPPLLACLYPKTLKPFVLPATCHLTTSYLLSPLSLLITVFPHPWIHQSADHNNVCCALL